MVTSLSPQDLQAARDFHLGRERARLEAREARRSEWLQAARRAIRELAPDEPALDAVFLFGSILQPRRFSERSDIDVAVDCVDPAAESRFWGALERKLRWNVDLRPRVGAIACAVEDEGERVYEREAARSRA